jgi:hypothetical protein
MSDGSTLLHYLSSRKLIAEQSSRLVAVCQSTVWFGTDAESVSQGHLIRRPSRYRHQYLTFFFSQGEKGEQPRARCQIETTDIQYEYAM